MRVPARLRDPTWWRQVQWFAPWRVALTLLVIATIWGLVDVRRRGFPYPEAPGEHKSDLTVYTEAGAAFFDGRAPYEVCNPRGWTYVYPPLLAMVLAPLHALPMQHQVMLWFFICLAMCWGAYRECARIVAAIEWNQFPMPVSPRTVRWFGAIALVTAALPTLNCLQRGQVTIVIVYFLLLGARLVITGRSQWVQLLGGVILAIPVVIKIVPILPIALLLLAKCVGLMRTQRRNELHSSIGFALGLVLVFLLLPATLVGWSANLRHLDTWSDLVLSNPGKSTATPGFEKDTHSVRNQCLGNALYRLGNFGAYLWAGGPEDPLVDEPNPPPRLMDAPVVDTCLLAVRATLLLALLLVSLRLFAPNDAVLGPATALGLACVTLLVVSPVARNHYFILIGPGVLFVPLWLASHGRGHAAMVMAIVPGVLVLSQYLLLPYVGRVGLLGLGTAAWVLAAMVLVARSDAGETVSARTAGAPASPDTLPLSCAA